MKDCLDIRHDHWSVLVQKTSLIGFVASWTGFLTCFASAMFTAGTPLEYLSGYGMLGAVIAGAMTGICLMLSCIIVESCDA